MKKKRELICQCIRNPSMSSVLEYNSSDFADLKVATNTLTKFSQMFREGWERARLTGALRYDVRELRCRCVRGAYSYLLQLNPERRSKRRCPEFIEDIRKVFDPNGFHFGLVPQSEVILQLKHAERDELHSLLVNVSPISELHSLLCPSVRLHQPQVVTEDSLRVALEVYFLAGDRDLRVGFNSLCALASVNHLHYHLLLEGATLPVESVKCKHLIGPLFCLESAYPVPAFCFQVHSDLDIAKAAQDIHTLIAFLLEHSIAHNLLVTRGKDLRDSKTEVVRILVWPRKSSRGAKQLEAFNVAVLELAGWFPVYDKEHFIKLEASDIEKELNIWKVKNFEEIVEKIILLYKDS